MAVVGNPKGRVMAEERAAAGAEVYDARLEEMVSDEFKQQPNWRERAKSGRAAFESTGAGVEAAGAAFRVGDAAALRSGGPVMRVIGLSPNGRVWCEWALAGGYVEEASFPPEMLRPATRP